MDRPVLAVAVAFLAVVAGCGGALPGSSDGDGDAPALSAQSWTDGESVAFEALFERHNAVVANATSIERRAVTASGDQETRVRVVGNRDTERAYLNISTASRGETQIQRTYVADGRLYAESGTASDPEYANQSFEQDFDQFLTQQTALTVHAAVVAQWDWEYDGFEDGAFVFEADTATASDDVPRGALDIANVTETSATLRVTERGLVRELVITATVDRTGATRTVRSVSEYVGLNETTVEEPGWLSEA
jgi:hypothetical protein